jgi:hypothetical protein
MLLYNSQGWFKLKLKLKVETANFERKPMKTPEARFLPWQQQFNTEQDCLKHLKQLK